MMFKSPSIPQGMQKYLRYLIGPFLLTTCVLIPLVMLMWYTNVALNGSVQKLYSLFSQRGVFSTVYTIWHPYFFGTVAAWKIFCVFVFTSLILIRVVPGRRFYDGPITSDGTLTVSKVNGFFVFAIVLGLFLFGSLTLGLFPATLIYDHFPGLIGVLNLFSMGIWLISYLMEKRPMKSVQKKDRLVSFFDWRINIFTICRCAMIGWGLAIVSFALKQHAAYGLSDSMIISVSLQLIFIAKFFLWEIGYLRAMDIAYDRSGFCLFWGTIVWIPAIYTSPTLYLVGHPHHLGLPLSLIIFGCGAGCILINLLVDRQRHYVRTKNGECLVWRKKPDLIFANYKTDWGEEKQNLLLVSGWWGISRHFHYLPELLGAFFWSIPALFYHFLPYFYLCFLALLLIDRTYRHERRCAIKYGKDWEKYCEKVPFRLIPFIY